MNRCIIRGPCEKGALSSRRNRALVFRAQIPGGLREPGGYILGGRKLRQHYTLPRNGGRALTHSVILSSATNNTYHNVKIC